MPCDNTESFVSLPVSSVLKISAWCSQQSIICIVEVVASCLQVRSTQQVNAQPILLTAHRMFSPVAHVLKHTKRKGVPCTPPPAPRKQTPSATVPSHISAAMALMLGRRCLSSMALMLHGQRILQGTDHSLCKVWDGDSGLSLCLYTAHTQLCALICLKVCQINCWQTR